MSQKVYPNKLWNKIREREREQSGKARSFEGIETKMVHKWRCKETHFCRDFLRRQRVRNPFLIIPLSVFCTSVEFCRCHCCDVHGFSSCSSLELGGFIGPSPRWMGHYWFDFFFGKMVWSICYTVLKTGPDRPVRPVQPGTGSQSGPVNTPKTGQKPENRSKTGVEPEIKKKNGLMSGSVFKTM